MKATLAQSVCHICGIQSKIITDTLLVAFGTLFVSLMAQITVPLYPVPITGQTLAVLLVGASYGARRASLSMGLYVLIGCLGVPVFAGESAGMSVIIGPTGGYILGFILSGAVLGHLAQKKGWGQSVRSALPLFLIGQTLIFTLGVSWLAFQIGLPKAIQFGLLPFMPGAVIKLSLATVLLPSAWRGVSKLDAT